MCGRDDTRKLKTHGLLARAILIACASVLLLGMESASLAHELAVHLNAAGKTRLLVEGR